MRSPPEGQSARPAFHMYPAARRGLAIDRVSTLAPEFRSFDKERRARRFSDKACEYARPRLPSSAIPGMRGFARRRRSLRLTCVDQDHYRRPHPTSSSSIQELPKAPQKLRERNVCACVNEWRAAPSPNRWSYYHARCPIGLTEFHQNLAPGRCRISPVMQGLDRAVGGAPNSMP